MRFIIYVILSLIVACNEKEGVWDTLSSADRIAISLRAYNECKTDVEARFNSFKDGSYGVYSSSNWQRHKAWKHELKASGSTTAEVTNNIRVWKNSGTEIYFLITQDIGSSTKIFFLRIPSTVNDSMIDNLKEQYCRKQVALSGTSSPMSVVEEYSQTVGTGTYEYKETYTFDFDKLAFTGSAWKFNRVLKKKDSSGTVTSTTTLNSTLTYITGLADLEAVYTAYGSATFCDVTLPTGDGNTPPITYKVPYTLSNLAAPTVAIDPSACPTTLPGAWSIVP
ncbi:MAG: hypothetical protein K2P81_16815 [Bacteriovoracaceae bacterium]|nr:hypothetical protein [Bacteriovoracaceae bacterium]